MEISVYEPVFYGLLYTQLIAFTKFLPSVIPFPIFSSKSSKFPKSLSISLIAFTKSVLTEVVKLDIVPI